MTRCSPLPPVSYAGLSTGPRLNPTSYKFLEQNFIGTPSCPIVYMVPLAAFGVLITGLRNLKHLLSGLLQKFVDLCFQPGVLKVLLASEPWRGF